MQIDTHWRVIFIFSRFFACSDSDAKAFGIIVDSKKKVNGLLMYSKCRVDKFLSFCLFIAQSGSQKLMYMYISVRIIF